MAMDTSKIKLVCPAQAGMIRTQANCGAPTISLPRTSGDDQDRIDGPRLASQFAPHKRG